MKKQTYIGLFMVTLSTLMYEILLTRIFSVTMWYHFAFMAISVAMFGMTVGALLVYLFPQYFTQNRIKYHLALSSLLFAVSIIISFLTHLSIPFVPHKSFVAFYSIALTFVVISIPFIFSGICVSLALTKFPRQIGKLYAADLAGAAIGCILLIYVLRITDGPTAVFAVALLSSIGAALFCIGESFNKLLKITLIVCILLASFVTIHAFLINKQNPLLRLIWIKGKLEREKPLYEKWNSYSRISITGNTNKPEEPTGWGLSSLYPSDRKVRQLHMLIDSTAATVLTAFDGDLNKIEHLKYDVTNLAHYIRKNAKILVVGAGGGRDILSALAFDQESVVAIELNKDIIKAVNQRFGSFTGHLDRNPRVIFVPDEARSYIARQEDNYDIIQVSLIDTWAATAAGAFVLAENSLYTVEAWNIFLEHLTPNGVLTFSRWYFQDNPGEMYRLASLASASLLQLGVDTPQNNIIILKQMRKEKSRFGTFGIGSILLSKEPFSKRDIDTIEKIANKMNFDLVLSPRFSLDSTFTTIASGKNLDTFTANFPINIKAPTDDSPFFFHMLRLKDVLKIKLWQQWPMNFNMKAVFILAALLIIVIGLTFLCIIVPLILTTKKEALKGALPLFIFFAGIGFGFMFIEISQMQRLIIFLGHPNYGLSVVLFTLLLSSGIGSYSTQRIGDPGLRGSATKRLLLLLCMLIVFAILTPYIISISQGLTTTLRILVAVGTLFPLGLFMGMAFPLGMKIAFNRSASITPWLWGINGSTSVCASVLAVAIALSSSISISFFTGFFCYVAAFIALIWASH